MRRSTTRCVCILLTAIMCIGLLVGLVTPASAATVTYKYGSYSGYSKVILNWGQRGVDATFLSPNAEAFYEDNAITYDDLSVMSGATNTSSVPSSALYKELQELMASNHTKQTNYGDTRYLYCFTDCQNNNDSAGISAFYSGRTVGPDWDGGTTWNREHTWPKSKTTAGTANNSSRGEVGDIIMLRPAVSNINSSRGNKAYGESAGYYDPNSVSNGAYNIRGDAARTLLYVYVRWGNTSYMWGSAGVMENKDVLLRWIEEDPVDTWELARNDSVESITGTRNVFVDYPELAFLLFNEEIPEDMTTPSGKAADSNSGVVHDIVHHDAKAATCTEIGWEAYDTCTRCDYTTYVEIPAKGHTPGAEATCTVAQTCTVCGAELNPALGHDTVHHDAKAATCTEIGWEAYDTCTRCDYTTYVEIPAKGQTPGLEYLTYVITNGQVTITDCDTSVTGKLEIPSTIEGYPVTSIGEYAFSDCSSLTGVIIPEGVTNIGHYAFRKCSSLISIAIPDSVTSIEGAAFHGCSSLSSITIPSSVTIIDASTFTDCSSLTSITIPDSVTSIGANAFTFCTGLTSITIPDSVQIIDDFVFDNCSSLTNITIPSSVKSMGWGVFNGCSSLSEITIPNSLQRIGYYMFYDCTGLTSITIPNSVTSIGEFAFYRCSSLKDVFYTGTRAQWEAISIAGANDYLLSATFHTVSIREGWELENGKWVYYENGAKVKNAWRKDTGGLCYLNADGILVTNRWVRDGADWRYVDRDGHSVTNKWVRDSVGLCYLNGEGKLATNCWVQEGAAWRYVDGEGHSVTNKWVRDSAGLCYLNADGILVTNRWVRDGADWRYVDRDGHSVINKWVRDSVGLCYLNADGILATNRWVQDGAAWRYVDSEGYSVTNKWVRDSVGLCYLNSDGKLVTNRWVRDGATWRYVDRDGHSVTNKWVRDSVTWCYLDSEGKLATNTWQRDSAGLCYLDGAGHLVTNRWVRDGKNWRYVDRDGHSVTNTWQRDSAGWCYLDSEGYAVTGTTVIDGKEYHFNSNGVCTNR